MDLADHVHRVLTRGPLRALALAALALWGVACGPGERAPEAGAGDGGEPAAGDRAGPGTETPAPGEFRVRVHFHREEELAAATRPGRVPHRPAWVAFSHLLEGPSPPERHEGLHSFFSDSTAGMLRGVDRRGDTLVVDFGSLQRRIPGAGSSAGSRELLDALNATAFQFPWVAAVEYRMEGSCTRFWNWLQRACQVVPRPDRRREPASRARETR